MRIGVLAVVGDGLLMPTVPVVPTAMVMATVMVVATVMMMMAMTGQGRVGSHGKRRHCQKTQKLQYP